MEEGVFFSNTGGKLREEFIHRWTDLCFFVGLLDLEKMEAWKDSQPGDSVRDLFDLPKRWVGHQQPLKRVTDHHPKKVTA